MFLISIFKKSLKTNLIIWELYFSLSNIAKSLLGWLIIFFALISKSKLTDLDLFLYKFSTKNKKSRWITIKESARLIELYMHLEIANCKIEIIEWYKYAFHWNTNVAIREFEVIFIEALTSKSFFSLSFRRAIISESILIDFESFLF